MEYANGQLWLPHETLFLCKEHTETLDPSPWRTHRVETFSVPLEKSLCIPCCKHPTLNGALACIDSNKISQSLGNRSLYGQTSTQMIFSEIFLKVSRSWKVFSKTLDVNTLSVYSTFCYIIYITKLKSTLLHADCLLGFLKSQKFFVNTILWSFLVYADPLLLDEKFMLFIIFIPVSSSLFYSNIPDFSFETQILYKIILI